MYYLTCGTLKWKIQCSSHSLERCVHRCYQKIFDILILYICTINGCQNYLVCSKRIETLISECLCIFIGRIQVIFIGLWPGTQSRIGTSHLKKYRPKGQKYGVRETGKQCLVGPTEAKPGIFAGAKIPGCLLRALPPSPHKQLHSGAGCAFRWNAFSIAWAMDSTRQKPHQEQAAGGWCFALLTRFPSCASEQTRGKAAAGFPSRKA